MFQRNSFLNIAVIPTASTTFEQYKSCIEALFHSDFTAQTPNGDYDFNYLKLNSTPQTLIEPYYVEYTDPNKTIKLDYILKLKRHFLKVKLSLVTSHNFQSDELEKLLNTVSNWTNIINEKYNTILIESLGKKFKKQMNQTLDELNKIK